MTKAKDGLGQALRQTKNIVRNAMRSRNAGEMTLKVTRRLERSSQHFASNWAAKHAHPIDSFCEDLDPKLWHESREFGLTLKAYGAQRLAGVDVDLGGGGAYTYLHFFTRFLRPATVLETGVAAGWSSYALLAALEQNDRGRLLSSDFPYFRMKNPNEHIGMLVPNQLRHRWTLDLSGDRRALPRLLLGVSKLDLVHYDSDKSYRGRNNTMSLLDSYLSPETLIIMDDIQDNRFFHDWVVSGRRGFRIFEFEGKYVGMSGGPVSS